jgi:hypothetical protein
MAILVSAVFAIASTITPYQVVASDLSQKEVPTVTNATLSHQISANYDPFQASYLSLSLTTDKVVYLAGETVNITVSTSTIDTHINLMAQLPDGSQQTIENFTLNYTHTVSWTAPAASGQIRLTCAGEALTEVWDYCTRYVCIGPGQTDCHWQNYPCFRTISITGSAFNNIRVFKRTASVSGRIVDTNQKPVAGASVSILSTGQSTTSNNDGNYQFSSYQLGNNYALTNQIPTVTDTVNVDAVACEPQPGRTIQILAEVGTSEVNFTLKRAFYPPDLDLSEFNFAAFPGWPAAKEYATWQNIAGITIDGSLQSIKFQYGTREISPLFFNIGGKKMYLVTTPEFGRYFLDIQGAPGTQYKVAAAATLGGTYLQPVTVNPTIESGNSQRLRFILEQDQMQLQVINPFQVFIIIIPIVIVVLGGLAAAYFLTGGKMRWGKLFAGRKPSPTTEISKANETVKTKSVVKSAAKRPTRRRAKAKKSTGKASL